MIADDEHGVPRLFILSGYGHNPAMIAWRHSLTAIALAAAAPAAAQVPWNGWPGTPILRDATGCSVRFEDGAISVDLRQDRDGNYALRVSSDGWNQAEGRNYPVWLWGFESLYGALPRANKLVLIKGNATGLRDARGWHGFSLPLTAGELSRFARYQRMYVHDVASGRDLAPPLQAMGRHVTPLSRCVSGLTRADPGSGKPAIIRAAPRGGVGINTWFTNDDYPAAALRAEQEPQRPAPHHLRARHGQRLRGDRIERCAHSGHHCLQSFPAPRPLHRGARRRRQCHAGLG
ncbi:hypothetical protein P1X14_05270 [Sphingomonas sp. AOB5]|uniref:hypothetical protein n=1 Tax=Sphingomonas sp. AOB5 TaxID=3034017 RepID=UPI0023F7CA45|nr:hypothetical protein [Sphingomonas sp. AOB5]MDF7774649.1 hypothetical protein [Sphingomonas sp. AOB5]